MTTDSPNASKLGRWQFSLRGLLGGVAFVAVGCVALVNADILWTICMLTAALAMLFVGLIGCVVLRGQRQAFWSGFAIVGWGYFLLVQTSPGVIDHNRLVTTSVLRNLHTVVVRERYWPVLAITAFPGNARSDQLLRYGSISRGGQFPTYSFPDQLRFSQVGHSLWTLLLAYLGGLLARYFYSTRTDEK